MEELLKVRFVSKETVWQVVGLRLHVIQIIIYQDTDQSHVLDMETIIALFQLVKVKPRCLIQHHV